LGVRRPRDEAANGLAVLQPEEQNLDHIAVPGFGVALDEDRGALRPRLEQVPEAVVRKSHAGAPILCPEAGGTGYGIDAIVAT
jgi:hypothetical protein